MSRRVSILLLILLRSSTSLWAKEPLPTPLRLPPSLEQLLPLSKAGSYLVDGLRAVDCPDDKDNQFGTCGRLLFGGLAMTGSHLSGFIRIRFFPPVRDITYFEVSHPGELRGEDGILRAPLYFQLPMKDFILRDAPGCISSGRLNLLTGEVTDLVYNVSILNSGLSTLAQANPRLEIPPARFPGIYGSSWARFEQRPDGMLDFTFHGSTFLPLGNKIDGDIVRWPLPFCNLKLQCATIPSPGTSLHPHLHLTTQAPEGSDCGANCPKIPFNTIQEYTTFTSRSSFGDEFSLKIPQLGGDATGRSHLLGRFRIHFGERWGDSVSFAVSSLLPVGFLGEPPKSPLSVPGLSLGLFGHNEFLKFPKQTYLLQRVAFADDPFDIALGAINLKTGKVIGELLYRGFIAQDLLFALLEQNDDRIAPSSFHFRGPAVFEKGANGQTVFRFDGSVTLDFSGFRFPSPDHVKANSWIAGDGSVLQPFLRIQAMHPDDSFASAVNSGGGSAVASTGDRFSYTYSIPCDPAGQKASFEYTNQNATQGGTFRMHSLASVSCTNSRTSGLPAGNYDTVTFTGFGTWNKDSEPHVATVQISTSLDPLFFVHLYK